MIIDFHTHAFPDKLAPGALAHLTENARAYAHLYGEAHPHTDATLDGLTASARRAGIDFSLVRHRHLAQALPHHQRFRRPGGQASGASLLRQRASRQSRLGGGAGTGGRRSACGASSCIPNTRAFL